MVSLEERQWQCQKLMANVANGQATAEKEPLEKCEHLREVSYYCAGGWVNERMRLYAHDADKNNLFFQLQSLLLELWYINLVPDFTPCVHT
jgi:hypothetical protein